MAAKGNLKQRIATVCMVLAMLLVTALYVVGCVQQARGKYRHERDARDQVKGQIQPVPHELGK